MHEKLVELLEPYMSGEPCDAESGSCELMNCRTCDAIALAHRLIFHDVVPVVRCKDCKHRYSDSWCEYVDSENFFCARGERKEADGNG